MAKTQTKTQGIALEKVGDAGDFSGYAATWSNVDHQGDRIVKGAFTATLPSFRSQRGVICWQHDQSRPVAYVVEILEDDVGLFVAAKFHSVPSAQEARTIVLERAAIGLPHGLSIGFGIAPGGSRFVGNVRELLKLDLLEVSLVAIPAYAPSSTPPVMHTRVLKSRACWSSSARAQRRTCTSRPSRRRTREHSPPVPSRSCSAISASRG